MPLCRCFDDSVRNALAAVDDANAEPRGLEVLEQLILPLTDQHLHLGISQRFLQALEIGRRDHPAGLGEKLHPSRKLPRVAVEDEGTRRWLPPFCRACRSSL